MEQNVKALFLDLSGVIYEGDQPIPGAIDAVARARNQNLILRFVTNTATSSSRQIIDKLARLGLHIEADELFTAPIAAKAYIQQHGLHPFCLIHQAIRPEFADIDQQQVDCVLLGDARDDLTYAALNQAFQLCKQGAPLIGIGMNKYFKDENGLNLDAGAFIHALEWAADTHAIIMGKPSKAFFDQIVASTPYDATECLMVGDDLIGDVKGAIDAGLQACLVKTGKFQPQDTQQLPAGAELADSLASLLM